ncbi:DNA photolyase, FAD-binding/Cryptochrome [Lentinula raphanica]|uniref:Cryptochrome DASH n=1 Tax=Lentinula raphanica TaxID=153919 RepID=A0AA38P3Z0_9AGAR|nr:DNA photolyase, FAD-binding/Cryptochrome [Lentinula raphanica]
MYLIYLLRRDLRISDNPIFHHLQQHPNTFTHLLPLYILSPNQIEVSGLLHDPDNSGSPYPQARSRLGQFWRCGPHRAKFIAESVWDVKQSLKDRGSDLVVRVGRMEEVVRQVLQQDEFRGKVGAVWMTKDWASEEVEEERKIEEVVEEEGDGKIEWKVWDGEEMLLHDNDFATSDPAQVPDVFTSFRKSFEPLRDSIRSPYISTPSKLPPLPPHIPAQAAPFSIPDSLEEFSRALRKPVEDCGLGKPISKPQGATTAHPFIGGETRAHERIVHLIASGSISSYKDTRNGLLGEDFSTKLSAYLALGCVTARQINAYMVAFEDGKDFPDFGIGLQFEKAKVFKSRGFGKGENKGTAAVRFELLWRDYMRLCMRKFGNNLFSIEGFRGVQQQDNSYNNNQRKNKHNSDNSYHWSDLSSLETRTKFTRFLRGETGTGLIDASMRELALTGYTSNRTRQNCASFLAKWLGIDWRLGAEWYECMLIDYDVASNWGNWAYVAGVGNDPRGRNDGSNGTEGRKFNPVKQAWDYDPRGEYVKAWIAEFEDVPGWQVNDIFQHPKDEREREVMSQLKKLEWVNRPLVRIQYRPRAEGKSQTNSKTESTREEKSERERIPGDKYNKLYGHARDTHHVEKKGKNNIEPGTGALS